VVAYDVALAAGRAAPKDDLARKLARTVHAYPVRFPANDWPAVRVGTVPGRLVGHFDHQQLDPAGVKVISPGHQPERAVERHDDGEGLSQFAACPAGEPAASATGESTTTASTGTAQSSNSAEPT
jgi:hypothetical protein